MCNSPLFLAKITIYVYLGGSLLFYDRGKLIDNRGKYDVTCVKMPKNEHKYLAFPSSEKFISSLNANELKSNGQPTPVSYYKLLFPITNSHKFMSLFDQKQWD